MDYQNFLLRDQRPFIWETNDNLLPKNFKTATKLYQLSTNTIAWTKNANNIPSYAIMSYVWGDLSDQDNLITWYYTYQTENETIESKKLGVNKNFGITGTIKGSIQTLKKALFKC